MKRRHVNRAIELAKAELAAKRDQPAATPPSPKEQRQRHVDEAVASQLIKLEQRIRWLSGKASRLPVASNGRDAAEAESRVLWELCVRLRAGVKL